MHALTLIAALTSCIALPAQQLLSDLNPATAGSGSLPDQPVVFNGATYFAATDTNLGRELFRLDRLTGTPTLLADLSPGAGSSNPGNLTVAGSLLFFSTLGGLYATDGTTTGTILLRGGANSTRFLTALGNRVVFAVTTGGTRGELWVSDGTVAGTAPFISSSTGTFLPLGAASLGNVVVISAISNLFPLERVVISTDGTAPGTSTILRQNGVTPGSVVAIANGRALFSGPDAANNPTIFITDGTSAGTQPLIIGAPGRSWRVVNPLGTGAILARGGLGGEELWFTDGTPAGTAPVQGTEAFTQINSAVELGNQAVFLASAQLGDPAGLYATDGSTYRLVREMEPSFQRDRIVSTGSAVFFAAADPNTSNDELWISDGTTSGTNQVAEIRPGRFGANINSMLAVGSNVFFSANDGFNGTEPWRSDGTAAGTTQIATLNRFPSTRSSEPEGYVDALGLTWFGAADSNAIFSLWSTDGTSSGTRNRTDVFPETSNRIVPLAEVGNRLFFFEFVRRAGQILYSTDGVTSQPVGSEIMLASFNAEQAAQEDRFLYFTRGASGTIRLWEADELGERVLGTFPNLTSVGQPFSLGQDILFTGLSTTSGSELWSLAAGGPIVDLNPGAESSLPNVIGQLGSRIIFAATDGIRGYELWSTDGTASGTGLIADISPGPGNGYVNGSAKIDDTIFFYGSSQPTGVEIWQTDGTPGNTRQTVDISPGSIRTNAGGIVAQAGLLFVTRFTSAASQSILSVDPETAQVTTLASGPAALSLFMTPLGSRRVLFILGRSQDASLWETDGKPQGTRQLTPVALQVSQLVDRLHVRRDGIVMFTADDGTTGNEPWVLDPGAVAQSLVAGGCAQLRESRLSATDPILGAPMGVTVDSTPSSGGLLLLGFPGRIDLGSGCRLAIDPSQPLAGQPIAVGPNGQATTSFAVPNSASLAGLNLTMQALLGPGGMPQGGPVFGYDLTNPVALRLGN